MYCLQAMVKAMAEAMAGAMGMAKKLCSRCGVMPKRPIHIYTHLHTYIERYLNNKKRTILTGVAAIMHV